MTIQHRMIQLITLPAESVVMSAADYEHLVAGEATIKHLAQENEQLRKNLDDANEKLRRAGRPLDEREPQHCPTCECGGEAQIRQLCPECLGYMPCAQHPSCDGSAT